MISQFRGWNYHCWIWTSSCLCFRIARMPSRVSCVQCGASLSCTNAQARRAHADRSGRVYRMWKGKAVYWPAATFHKAFHVFNLILPSLMTLTLAAYASHRTQLAITALYISIAGFVIVNNINPNTDPICFTKRCVSAHTHTACTYRVNVKCDTEYRRMTASSAFGASHAKPLPREIMYRLHCTHKWVGFQMCPLSVCEFCVWPERVFADPPSRRQQLVANGAAVTGYKYEEIFTPRMEMVTIHMCAVFVLWWCFLFILQLRLARHRAWVRVPQQLVSSPNNLVIWHRFGWIWQGESMFTPFHIYYIYIYLFFLIAKS